jgi:transmembrane sensor
MEDRFHSLIARKCSGALTPGEAEELDSMLRSDPSKAMVMEWFEQMILQERKQLPSTEAQEAYIRHWLKHKEEIAGPSPADPEPTQVSRSGIRGLSRMIPAALALVVLVGSGLWWMWGTGAERTVVKKTNPPSAWQAHVTRTAEKRKVSLPDGSIVWLNAGSSLHYDPVGLRQGQRQVYLEGEAFFDIAHDTARPFRVRCGAMEIKVLGTAFNVKAYPEAIRMETSLIRGSVEVRLDHTPDEVYQLKPSEKLVVSKQADVPADLTSPDPERKPQTAPLVTLGKIALTDSGKVVEEMAWLKDKLVFRSEPFTSLAHMLERRYGYHFVFEDQNAMTLEFTGSFTTETIEQALRAMQLVHGFQFRIDKENIYIR